MSVTVNNNSPIQDYVHPDDQTQPLTCLFLFIMVEFKSYYSVPTYKWYSFFCYENLSKGYNVLHEFMFESHMRFCLTQWSATGFYGSLNAYSGPLPSEKIESLRYHDGDGGKNIA